MADKDYKRIGKETRQEVLKMIHGAGTSHIASNFSATDFAVVLYEVADHTKDKICWSKGWSAALAYSLLARHGFIPKEDLELFGKEVDGKIKYLGLLETGVNGIYGAGGAMGHLLPIACGMALAKKLKGEEGNIYCIMSDGEMNEGTTWESAMFAKHHKLDNLIVIVDQNKWQAMGKTEDVLDVDLNKAWAGFGWSVKDIGGHDYGVIDSALTGFASIFPKVIIAHTIKGKGVSFMEDHLLYHYKHVDDENYLQAKKELENAR